MNLKETMISIIIGMNNLDQLLQKLANTLNDNRLSPQEKKQKKKEFVTKLAYKYLEYEKASLFDELYNSQRVAHNKLVYYQAEQLYSKYKQEIDKWKDYTENKRNRSLRYSRQ